MNVLERGWGNKSGVYGTKPGFYFDSERKTCNFLALQEEFEVEIALSIKVV